ncbi:MAG: adenylosuccinate lyase [Candidatus Marinimicrobia bacterium CG08_land_8_20_14_0_20_45_22]|nr:MAG: adenylosuccinate lyase [Candidatus Marinimicrobia bacterium CG08_land_8_20_14_0_20_45_22]
MIGRYTRAEMGKIWSEQHKFETWWKVELEVCRVQKDRGVIPESAFVEIESRAEFDIARIEEIEATVRHDVIAFLTNISENIGDSARFIHQGMTSSDLLDTALAIQLGDSGELILADLKNLINILDRQAIRYKLTPMIGRTHGIHAEPITFGLKFLIWKQEMLRHLRRFELALMDVKVGKISGAVGTYQHLEPEVEQKVCKNLGLQPAPVSNQIIQRDRHAFFVATLALIGASLEKIATEIRHLQRTEVLEAEEYFSKGQKGSSAMPHKRNPILSERICGMARLLRGYMVTAMENVPLWHERDISHSSAERIILPDACICADFILTETARVLDNLVVYPENMKHNLDKTGGLIFSQEVLLALVNKGMSREDAYAAVQNAAMEVWQNGGDFKQKLEEDPAVSKHLTDVDIDELFDLKKVLSRIEGIFQRLEREELHAKR